jgi:spermidine synthase
MGLGRRQLLGVFLTSMSALTLEVVLTRVFSVTMRYHFAFLAISLALMGNAIAGVVLYFLPGLTSPAQARRWGGLAALALAIAVPVTLLLYVQIPFHQVRGGAGFPPRKILYLTLIYLDMTIPFLLSGLILSMTLSAWPERANHIYWADLSGAALGCLFSILALETLGGAGAVLAVAGVAALAGLVLLWGLGRQQVLAVTAVLTLTALTWGNARQDWISIAVGETKGKRPSLLYEHWNAHSQVTVHKISRYPFFWSVDLRYWNRTIEEGRYLNHALLLIDDIAGTPVQEFRGLLEEVEFLRYDLTSLVYHMIEQPRTLVIGPGGGRDVLAALASGAPHVTAVEVNPAIVNVVRTHLADFAGHLYDRPDVTVVVDDARGYIARSRERYDVIQASLIDTWAAGGSGTFALSENSLYTVEAFQTYYDHLTDRGMLTISRWYLTERPAETMRLVATGMAGWSRAGAADPQGHVVVVARPNAEGQIEGMATALFKRAPFTRDEVAALNAQSEELGFTVIYAPGLPVHEDVGRLIVAEDRAASIADYPLDISPATDDRPFFFNLVRFGDFFDLSLNTSGVYRTGVEALVILGAVLALTAATGVVFVILPLSLVTRRRGGSRPSWRLLTYFGGLGVAFMLVEVPTIQRLTVYLGRPVYSLAVVLFSILLFSGLGSLWAGLKVRDSDRWLMGWLFPLLVASVALHGAAGGWLLQATMGWPLAARLGMTVALLAPLSLLMGMPFPLGMRWAGARYPQAVPWLWGINGVTSVMGSALSTALAIHFGLSAALLMAMALYGLAGGLLAREISRAASGPRTAA